MFRSIISCFHCGLSSGCAIMIGSMPVRFFMTAVLGCLLAAVQSSPTRRQPAQHKTDFTTEIAPLF